MKRGETALLLSPVALAAAIEARGLRQIDRAPQDRATYSAGGRRLFCLHTLAGRAVFLGVLGGVLRWFVPHMFDGAVSDRLAQAAAAALDKFDIDRPTFDLEEQP